MKVGYRVEVYKDEVNLTPPVKVGVVVEVMIAMPTYDVKGARIHMCKVLLNEVTCTRMVSQIRMWPDDCGRE